MKGIERFREKEIVKEGGHRDHKGRDVTGDWNWSQTKVVREDVNCLNGGSHNLK